MSSSISSCPPGRSPHSSPHQSLSCRPTSRPRPRPNFTLELLRSVRGRTLSPSNLDSLISALPSAPSHSSLPRSGLVAARLFFRQWCDALEAAVFLWDRRLRGSHPFSPAISSHIFAASDLHELSARLRPLFVGYVQGLLDGEVVQRCRNRVESLTKEIEGVRKVLGRRNRFEFFLENQAKKDALCKEREMVERKVEEFRSAMNSILGFLDEEWRLKHFDGGVEVLYLEKGIEWGRVHQLVLRECRRLEEALPIYAFRREILKQIHGQQVIVLIGETGSGKSTQVIQYISDSGLAGDGSIVCTQPRKIAATSLARRVREESYGCYLDDSVICYPTFSSAQKFNSNVVFTTDHCLLQHCMSDSNLSGISYVIIDEAHERTLNTDILLALLKKLLLKRLDLRLIIMSATVDAAKFSDYFYGCGTFYVQGRSFPVDIKYTDASETMMTTTSQCGLSSCASYVAEAIKVIGGIHRIEEDGAILAFLTSQSEVEVACESFQDPSAEVLPLHGKLLCEEQNRVFQEYPGKRKIIFATNLAETSLTIPGVKYVVDSGMVKESKFEPGSGMNVLRICRISQSSASQRAGRAGRTGPGKCYRLYSELDFQSMPSHQEPEIRRVHLGIAVLRILALGTRNVLDFDFVDAPDARAIELAIANLVQLDAVKTENGELELTDTGSKLVKLGIEPRLGNLILNSCSYNLGREGVVLAALMANASSIFCRVGNEDEKLKSECLKVQFCHKDGDLFTLLSVYKKWKEEGYCAKNLWCWENSINAKSMRRCEEAVREWEHCLQQELQIVVPSYWRWKPDEPSMYDALLKKAILSSLADNVAMYSGCDRLGYTIALTGHRVKLHPSCSLLIYDQKPNWVVFGEILSMASQYLVCVTVVDYEHLVELIPCPPFDVSVLEAQKLHKHVITGVRSNLLRRFCGKLNNSLHHLISRIQMICHDDRIGINVDFEGEKIEFFASSKNREEVSFLVHEVLEYETKWLRDECVEKCLFPAGFGFRPSIALFGAGAEIKYLELQNRYVSVEVFHPRADAIDDKELLMMFDKCAPAIAGYYKYVGTGQDDEDLEKWGRITFRCPDAAEKVVEELHGAKMGTSHLKVIPLQTTFVSDKKAFPFLSMKAKLSWPRRPSKGVAIVRCKVEDVSDIAVACSTLVIGGRFVRCKVGNKSADSIIITGLGADTAEPEVLDALSYATERPILDVFLLRGEAVTQLPVGSYTDALLREIASFMPSKSNLNKYCRVQVFQPEPKDYMMRAVLSFDGSLYHQAAMALEHIDGKALTGCLPWQKIRCERMFRSSISCSATIYHVIKKELDSLLKSFSCWEGVDYNLEILDNGSCRVKLCSTATKTVADLRKPLEQLMRGRTVTHPSLTPSVIQLLFSREGVSIMKTLGKDTNTYILHDKKNLNVKIFGSLQDMITAEEKLIQTLLHLHENKQVEIRLRSGDLPSNLLKEVVRKFGPNLDGLKEKVPGATFTLNTRRHVLSVRGNKELKQKVEQVIFEMAQSLCDRSNVFCNDESNCPICLCEVEERYRLEACGHDFCWMCLVEQCESAIRTRDGFPLRCAFPGCKAEIIYADLRALLTMDKLEELFRASLGAYVACSGGKYRFCPSPDCPGVYEAASPDSPEEQRPFACESCFVETCRKCHLEYHPSISCEKYREFKDDPDASLYEWQNGKEHVKACPVCNYTIEKVDGCNHIECKCGKHICWVCLECFLASDECYEHLRTVHLAII